MFSIIIGLWLFATGEARKLNDKYDLYKIQ